MKTIDATLLANQKLPNGRGFAAATLADNGRLHPVAVGGGAGSYSGGCTVAVECGSFYLRAKFTGGANTIDVQKITDPTVAAQWTTWTNLVASNVNPLNNLGLFFGTAYVVVAWQDLVTGEIKFRRSSDGTTWSAAAVARAAPGFNATLAGISAASPKCGLAAAWNQQLYWIAYNEATNTWSAAESAGATFTTATPEITAFCDTANNRYVIAVAVSGFASWAANAIVAYTRAVGSATWSTGQVLFSGNVAAYRGIQFAQRKIGGYWWLSFFKVRLWNVSPVTTQLVAASDDGLFFEDALPTPVAGNERALCILPAPSAGTWTNAYYSTERAIYRLDTYTYFSNATVVAYDFITGRGGHQEGGGPNGRGGASPTLPAQEGTLVLLLDNRAGALAQPRLFSVLTLTRGLTIEGTQYPVSAGPWFVTGYHYLMGDGLLQLTATDARGLLSSWFADNTYAYRNASVKFLVEWICALAGVHVVAFDATASWTDVVTAFSHAVGENATAALRSLAERVPFEYLVKEDGSLYFYVPTAGPTATYTFGDGAGEHRAWLSAAPRVHAPAPLVTPIHPSSNRPGPAHPVLLPEVPMGVTATPAWALNAAPWMGTSESVTYLQLIGSPPRNRAAEAIDQAALNAAGRRRTLIVNDRRVRTDPATTAAAAAQLVSAQERQRAGLFEAPPAFSLEPGDVIAFSGTTYPATAGPWRVEHFEEHFNRSGTKPFFQRISLRGTA